MNLMKKLIHKHKESITKFWLNLYKSSTLLVYIIIVLLLCYRLITELTLPAFIGFVIIAIISTLITTFVLDNFKYRIRNELLLVKRTSQSEKLKPVLLGYVITIISMLVSLILFLTTPSLRSTVWEAWEGIEQQAEISKILSSITTKNSSIINTEFICDMISKFQNYLHSLTIEQQVYLTNALGCIFVLACAFSLASIFYGDLLIVRFKLETKYPKLAKIIQLRRKFQGYYFTLNLIFIVVVLIVIIFYNIFFFLLPFF